MIAIAVWRALEARRRTTVRFVLAMVALVSFVFFIYSAVRQRVEPNWPAPAYIPAIVLLATHVVERARGAVARRRASCLAGADVARHLRAGARADPADPPPQGSDRARVRLARARANRVSTSAGDVADGRGSDTWLGGDRYQEAAELAFHDRRRIR